MDLGTLGALVAILFCIIFAFKGPRWFARYVAKWPPEA